MKKSELEKYLGKNVEVHFKSCVENNGAVYTGILTKCFNDGEKNLYYCKEVFGQEVRFRSSYV